MLATLGRTIAEAPALSATDRARLDAGPPRLGTGIRSASRRELLGLWRRGRPAGTWYDGGGHVRFRGSGRWTGSDGCNGQGGRWRYDDGRLLALPPGPREVACIGPAPPEGVRLAPPQPVASWVVTAVAAAFDGAILVLLDRDGRALGRLERSAN